MQPDAVDAGEPDTAPDVGEPDTAPDVDDGPVLGVPPDERTFGDPPEGCMDATVLELEMGVNTFVGDNSGAPMTELRGCRWPDRGRVPPGVPSFADEPDVGLIKWFAVQVPGTGFKGLTVDARSLR